MESAPAFGRSLTPPVTRLQEVAESNSATTKTHTVRPEFDSGLRRTIVHSTDTLMSRKYRHYADNDYIYFITSTVIEWIPLFLSHRYFNVLIDAFTYCRMHKGLRVHAYVIMPHHFHMIASSEPRTALPGIIRDLKRYTDPPFTGRRISFYTSAAEAYRNRFRWKQRLSGVAGGISSGSDLHT